MTIKLNALTILFAAAFAPAAFADTSLTIYNQNFGVVKQTIPMNLKAGVNSVSVTGVTSQVEPDSIILRDPSGKHQMQILEQNYRNDPISQSKLLDLFEGQTIDFQIGIGDKAQIIRGKIIRSGYAAPVRNPYGGGYQYPNADQPIIEVNSKLMFELPGTPLFPSLSNDTILKPTLTWQLDSDKGGSFDAEMAYVTGGMSWEADYNLVAPEAGSNIDVTGWITMNNQTGAAFTDAKIKLVAGDVNKIQPNQNQYPALASLPAGGVFKNSGAVTEKAFDEYHMYSLERTTTLRDRETKQVQFLTATGVPSKSLYVYDGAQIDQNYRYNYQYYRNDRNYGTQSNTKVFVMREFVNSAANGLGIPLPKGRVRFYRRDSDGKVEFVGENTIDHTPKDETIRVYTGNSFDLVGQRTSTSYNEDVAAHWIDETFQLKVRNHKKEAAEVRIVEHLYRWSNWEIRANSTPFTKKDSQTIEFPVTIQPDGEAVVTYTVHYSW